MALTVSAPNNVQSPSGNSLAVFKEATTNKFYVKDINGQIEELPSGGGGGTIIFEGGTGANSTQVKFNQLLVVVRVTQHQQILLL